MQILQLTGLQSFKILHSKSLSSVRRLDSLKPFKISPVSGIQFLKLDFNPDVPLSTSEPGEDLLLKVWYAKTDVRTRFLALRCEQRPLDPENRVGGGSKLGKSNFLLDFAYQVLYPALY